jgi:thiol-disulfide isomerase/thioredoxin
MVRNIFFTVSLALFGFSAAFAQSGSRQARIDSLQQVIDTQKDSSAALRQYIGILGVANDTVTTQFAVWMKKWPKSASVPFALGEAWFRARDRNKTFDYLRKAIMAGDTSARLFQMLHIADEERWAVDVTRTANTVDSLKRVIESNPDSLLPLQQYTFVLGSRNDTMVEQLNAWMQQFPRSTAIPYALGENYYNEESPKAKPYLLKVVALDPQNFKVWEMLSIDAERWGNSDSAREYMGRAAAAAPTEPSYAFYYAMDFEESDPAMFQKKLWELTQKFPESERGAQALYWLSYRSTDKKEKIKVLEKLRVLYPPVKFDWSEGGMDNLYDLYLQGGQTDKAIELAGAMGDKDGFPEKLVMAKDVAAVRAAIKAKNYVAAQQKVNHIKLPRYAQEDAIAMIALLKAEVADAGGSPQKAYDSLLVLQAKSPDEAVREAIAGYGGKLGKTAEQTDKDIWAVRDKNSKPAPPFELGLYTSDAKVRLADYRGKVVLLTFWFPGCGPCRGEMPHFQHVVNKYKKSDLAYLGINVTPEQDDYVLPFMKGTKFSFIPLRGTGKWAKDVYKVRGEPTNFLIDKEGKIVYSDFMINGNNERMLELMINSMLATKG